MIKQKSTNLRIYDLMVCALEKNEFVPNGEFTVVLTYPLEEKYEFKVWGSLTFYNLCVLVAKEYKKIYKKDMKYGVWGHRIEDLFIEKIKVNTDKNIINVYVGS